MAVYNCACIPLFEYEADFISGFKKSIKQVLIYGETKDSISGIPSATNFGEFQVNLLALEVKAMKAKPVRSGVPENQSVFGIPVPMGVDVLKTISKTARKLCHRLLNEKEATKFYELAVSPEGRALFLMSFWVFRAEQFQRLNLAMLQCLSKYYCSVLLHSTGHARDLIPILLTRSLAKILVVSRQSRSLDYRVTRQHERCMALQTATRFVAKYLSGGIGLGCSEGGIYSKVLFDTKAVSPLIASLDFHRPVIRTFLSLTP